MDTFYASPAVVGVNQLPHWDATTTIDDALTALGRNSGNMMFTESIFTRLRNATLCSFALTPQALEDRDCIVLAAANWINSYEDYGWLAERIERTSLPVILIGIGAQAPLDMSVPVIPAGTKRFLDIVAERSVSISARGQFSCEVLNHYGIKSVVPTGCPSLLLVGPDGPSVARKPTLERVVLHATRHGFSRCDELQRFIYRQAMSLGCDILLQSESADIYFALGRTNNQSVMEKAAPIVTEAYGTDDVAAISAYLQQHGLFYINYPTWINEMKERTLCMGTRIHGTVAAIIAGTPAVLIAHDSRTVELANAMNIPVIRSTEIPTDRDLDLETYAASYTSGQLVSGYPSYRQRFLDFFKQNRLALN